MIQRVPLSTYCTTNYLVAPQKAILQMFLRSKRKLTIQSYKNEDNLTKTFYKSFSQKISYTQCKMDNLTIHFNKIEFDDELNK